MLSAVVFFSLFGTALFFLGCALHPAPVAKKENESCRVSPLGFEKGFTKWWGKGDFWEQPSGRASCPHFLPFYYLLFLWGTIAMRQVAQDVGCLYVRIGCVGLQTLEADYKRADTHLLGWLG
eukprot:RCo040435